MRRFILLLLMLPAMLAAQNRIATPQDALSYGSYITAGDLILDTPTKVFSDGINQLRYTTVSKTFPSLRENGIIWVDGDKIGPLCEFRLLNVNETTPWAVSTITIKPIPNTRVNAIVTLNSYGGFLYLIQGLKNLRMEGSSDKYYGLNTFPSSRKFLKGSFGFGATSTGIYGGHHMYSISVLDGGTIYMEGFEGEHGFSVGRFEGGSYNWVADLTIENFYIHDTASEGCYIGATHSDPFARIQNLHISNGIVARSGSEALQMQHLTGKAWIHNVTLFANDAGYLNQFEPGQDTGMQISPDGGTILIENIVVDSWGSHGMNFFGTTYTATPKKTTVQNTLFNNGRGEVMYIHSSCKAGMNWNVNNLYVRGMNGEYYINSKTPKTNWIISANNGTDSVRVTNVFYDNPSLNPFQNATKFVASSSTLAPIADVEYVASGFYESADRIKNYAQYYAKYISGLDSLPVQYKSGDIIVDREAGYLPVFTKCYVDVTASKLRPKNDPYHYVKLTWDANGVRCDQPDWNTGLLQLPYPPDDLRVKWNNFYGKLNIGLVQQITINDLEQMLADQQTANKQLSNQNSQLQVQILELNQKIKSMVDDVTNTVDKYK